MIVRNTVAVKFQKYLVFLQQFRASIGC